MVGHLPLEEAILVRVQVPQPNLHLKSQTEFGLLKVQIRVADAPQGAKTRIDNNHVKLC